MRAGSAPEHEFQGPSRPPLRAKPGRTVTQLHYARRGEITPEMEFVAVREGVGAKLVRERLFRSSGRVKGGYAARARHFDKPRRRLGIRPSVPLNVINFIQTPVG